MVNMLDIEGMKQNGTEDGIGFRSEIPKCESIGALWNPKLVDLCTRSTILLKIYTVM